MSAYRITKRRNAIWRKRIAETTSAKGSAAKKSSNASDFDTISQLMKSGIEDGLRILKLENDVYLEEIDNFRTNLSKVSEEKAALERKNTKLIDEQKAFIKLIADLEGAKRIQTETFDEAKKKCSEKLDTIGEASRNQKKKFDDEKKILEQTIAVLEKNKGKAMCPCCQTFQHAVLFCSSECL